MIVSTLTPYSSSNIFYLLFFLSPAYTISFVTPGLSPVITALPFFGVEVETLTVL
jgi:hypothetical protein